MALSILEYSSNWQLFLQDKIQKWQLLLQVMVSFSSLHGPDFFSRLHKLYNA